MRRFLVLGILVSAIFCQIDFKYWAGPFANWQDCQDFANYYMRNGHTALCQYKF